jgi:hypothetical protein
VDVTKGYGLKWKRFFKSLEASHGLRVSIPEHKWLLHYLFHEAINEDAQLWAQTWNSHKLQIQGERTRSPIDMFFFGMHQEGERGLQYMQPQRDNDSNGIGNVAEYGIDWEAFEDESITLHLLENNPEERRSFSNPFTMLSSARPDILSSVVVDPPRGCPFDDAQLHELGQHLQTQVDLSSQSMVIRRTVWVEALAKCETLWNGSDQGDG